MEDSESDGEENPLIKAAKACDLHALRRAMVPYRRRRSMLPPDLV
jgi:hypothetical protein